MVRNGRVGMEIRRENLHWVMKTILSLDGGSKKGVEECWQDEQRTTITWCCMRIGQGVLASPVGDEQH